MTNPSQPKRIGLTIGEPAGVGPELALRVASDWNGADSLCLIGDENVLQDVARRLHLPCPPTIAASALGDHRSGVAIVSLPIESDDAVSPGRWTAATGEASYRWVCEAVRWTMEGSLGAIVTGPIQKEAWHAAGVTYPGHTELIADLTGTRNFRMMLTAPEITCVLVTIHVPLADVAGMLTVDEIYQTIRLADAASSRSLRRPANVVVLGLNPHAGENGLFSHQEEENIIAPAIRRAAADGIRVTGPISPDTAFTAMRRRETDVYVCMYHDQGLIPLKALAFDDAVNVTLGLPIVRTSVDHGTAMDIAWQGTASDRSLRAATRMAIDLA